MISFKKWNFKENLTSSQNTTFCKEKKFIDWHKLYIVFKRAKLSPATGVLGYKRSDIGWTRAEF